MYRHVIEVEGRFVDNLTNKAEGASRSISGVGTAAKQAAKDVNKLGSSDATPDVGLDTSKFTRAMDKVNGLLNKFKKVHHAALNLKDSNTYQRLKKITDTVEGLTRKTWSVIVKVKDIAMAPFNAVRNALFSIQTLATTIFAGIAAKFAIINPINLADAYSSAQIGFSTLLGQSAGQQMMNKIDEFAKATPFKTSGVISNVQKMMAYGWDVDRVIKDMETIGDAAAATGKGDEGLSSIVYALSEIRSKGKLSTQELNQLASAGIKAKAYLAEGLGFGTDDAGMAELAEALESGEIGANQAIDLILQGMEEFDGMMDKTANETVEGLISQIEDAFEISVVRKWGQGLQDGAKRGIGTVVELLDKAEAALSEFGDMLYDIAKVASNWVADKFEKTVSRILEITDTFEFQNASLKEKISMLWKGVVTDPLKEWWDSGGRAKTVETAGKIGAWMGKTLKAGLLAVFGITDILKGEDEDLGAVAEIAKSFSDGFRENFDASVVTDKLVEAIGNVWNALPAWAKVLLVGYGGTKLAIGGMNLVSGAANLIGQARHYDAAGNLVNGTGILGAIGNFSIANTALPHLTSSGSGLLGLLGKTGVAMGAYTTGGSLLLGGGTIAGGLTAAAGLGHTIKSGYDSYKAFKEGDETTGKAELARAGGTGVGLLAGAGIGAKAGAAIGSLFGGVGAVPGAIIGAGLGTVVGWFAGEKIAKNIEAAKYESEELRDAIKDSEKSAEELADAFAKAKWENAKEHFGDIKLSMEEINRLANEIVWGDDLTFFEQFSTATKTAETSLQSLKTASEQTNKWMWKAGLNVKFNDDEKESIIASFDDYLASAQAYIENKHYEFSMSASLLLDLESDEGKAIVEGGNSFFAEEQKKLEQAGEELGEALTEALADGIISAPEEEAIIAAQQKIADITEKISNAEMAAEMDLIKVKFGEGTLDYPSFQNLMATLESTLQERTTAAEDAFKVQVTNLRLRFPEEGPEFEEQLQALISGYTAKVESVKAEVMDVELGIIADAYSEIIDKDQLVAGLENAVQSGIDSATFKGLSDEGLARILGLDENAFEKTGLAADNLRDMLSDVLGQIELIDVDGKLLLNISGVETEDGISEKIKQYTIGQIPDAIEHTLRLSLTAEENIENNIDIIAEDFGIPKSKAETILWEIYSSKSIEEKLQMLAIEFGIPPSKMETIIWKLSGMKQISPLTITAGDFGINNTYTASPTVNITPKLGIISQLGLRSSSLLRFGNVENNNGGESNFRGGFVGGTSSAIHGFANGGFVRGGAQLVTVAEEGTPEVIIPLGSQRRQRGLDLWMKAGEMLGVNGFDGGRLATGGRDEGIRHKVYGGGSGNVSNDVHIDMGGVHVSISVDAKGGENVVEAIKAQGNEIAEVVAGILADELGGQFENTPAKGGAA